MSATERAALDDEALLAAWRAGDQRAGEQLFERHFDSIFDFFSHKISGDVGDLVQRTFLGCVEARDRFAGASSFRTFLFAIARHELYGYFRSRKKHAQLDFSVSSLADMAPGPSTLARARTTREAILGALRELPLDFQLVVELRYWEGLSGPDLAVVLDVPEGTVRSRIRRAIELLRERLNADPRCAGVVATSAGTSDAELDAWAASLRGLSASSSCWLPSG